MCILSTRTSTMSMCCCVEEFKPLMSEEVTPVQAKRAIHPACQRLSLCALAPSKDWKWSNQTLVTWGNGSVNHTLSLQRSLPGSFRWPIKAETKDSSSIVTIIVSVEDNECFFLYWHIIVTFTCFYLVLNLNPSESCSVFNCLPQYSVFIRMENIEEM